MDVGSTLALMHLSLICLFAILLAVAAVHGKRREKMKRREDYQKAA